MMDLAGLKNDFARYGVIEAQEAAWLIAEVDRLTELSASVMEERHETHDRLLSRAEKAEAERDTAYRKGQEDMRKSAAALVTECVQSVRTSDTYHGAAEIVWQKVCAIRALPIKKAALSAKEGGE
jgi:thioesterase domain-containing protein